MKIPPHFFLTIGKLILVIAVFMAVAVHSAPSDKPAAAAPVAGSSLAPQSIFVAPLTPPKDGRDPFFPQSTRLSPKIVKPSGPKGPVVTLVLNGLSPGLAMINGRTLAPGEESDVNTSTARVHIKLIEIREKTRSAIVEVGSERQELFLRGE